MPPRRVLPKCGAKDRRPDLSVGGGGAFGLLGNPNSSPLAMAEMWLEEAARASSVRNAAIPSTVPTSLAMSPTMLTLASKPLYSHTYL